MRAALLATVAASALFSLAAANLGPDFLHIAGMAFPTGPLSEPARQGRGLQLDTAFLADIPNRTSPSEFLIGTKIVAPFSFPVDPAEAGGRFVTDSVGPTKFSGYSWELWDK